MKKTPSIDYQSIEYRVLQRLVDKGIRFTVMGFDRVNTATIEYAYWQIYDPSGIDKAVNPPHYNGEECLDSIRAQLCPVEYRGFLRGTVARYNWRLGRKDEALKDARKAHWYQNKLVEWLSRG